MVSLVQRGKEVDLHWSSCIHLPDKVFAEHREVAAFCNAMSRPIRLQPGPCSSRSHPSDHTYRFLIHDRDSIFSTEVDDDLGAFGLKILRTPVQAPKANAYRERLIGSRRRECLDWVIPLNEKHLRRILREWVAHYNRGRPHASLGPGNPEPATTRRPSPKHPRHELPPDCRIGTKEVLGGLHHEYRLEKVAA
jgi:putative transposase